MSEHKITSTSEHKITSTDESVRGYPGTVARCTCGFKSSWGVQDGSAERDGADHLRRFATPDPSPTDAFEDAEIAREEADYTPPSIDLTWGTPGDIEQTSDGGGEYASGFNLTDAGIAKVAKALGIEGYLYAEFCRHENVPETGDRLHSAGEPSDLICLASPLLPSVAIRALTPPPEQELRGALREALLAAPFDDIEEQIDNILAAGYSRQSPASTTAADALLEIAPHHGFCTSLYSSKWECNCWKSQAPAAAIAAVKAGAWDEGYIAFRQASLDISDNPYRVAAPEGDGGDE